MCRQPKQGSLLDVLFRQLDALLAHSQRRPEMVNPNPTEQAQARILTENIWGAWVVMSCDLAHHPLANMHYCLVSEGNRILTLGALGRRRQLGFR